MITFQGQGPNLSHFTIRGFTPRENYRETMKLLKNSWANGSGCEATPLIMGPGSGDEPACRTQSKCSNDSGETAGRMGL